MTGATWGGENGGTWGGSGGFNIGSGRPPRPELLDVEVLSGTEVRLEWSNTTENEDNNHVYKSEDGVTFEKVSVLPQGAESYEVGGLLNDETYHFKITSSNELGESNPTPVSSSTTELPYIEDITIEVDGVNVGITWEDITNNEGGHRVMMRGSHEDEFWQYGDDLGSVEVGSTVEFSVSNLNPQIGYEVYIETFTGDTIVDGEVHTFETGSFSGDSIPAGTYGGVNGMTYGGVNGGNYTYEVEVIPPTGLSYTEVDMMTIELEWDNLSSADGFIVYRGTGESPDTTEEYLVGSSEDPSLEDTGVYMATEYTYAITSLVFGEESQLSEELVAEIDVKLSGGGDPGKRLTAHGEDVVNISVHGVDIV